MFAIGLSVTLLALASSGLGVSGPLTLRRADTIQKTLYASNFFYVLTLGFAKLSLLSFFYSIYHQRGQRRVVLAIGIFILAWTIASLATVAFQCGLPKPWEVLTLHCFNVVSSIVALSRIQISIHTDCHTGSFLDRLLHNRHDQRRCYSNAQHQPCGLPQSQSLNENCCHRLLRAASSCHRSFDYPLAILISDLTT